MRESARERVLEFCEEGLLSWEDVAFMALKFMSDAEVAEMVRLNELDLEDEDEQVCSFHDDWVCSDSRFECNRGYIPKMWLENTSARQWCWIRCNDGNVR